ncbi:MAG TPA: hypothetical protein VMB71_09245 [Acetobacteraceae bacterium]|nr:hypothetical protein [Acetobacteraceae bacterium]
MSGSPSTNLGFSPSGAERLLTDAAERALRAPRGKLALALHLSRLKPPAPRPHHARIARALLQDTAQRYSGQVFPLRNGDLVLLCAVPPAEGRVVAGQSSPTALPAALARLFGADAPDNDLLTTAWKLEEEGDRFWTFITARHTEAQPESAAEETAGTASSVMALEEVVATAFVPDLLAQQTAIRLHPGRNLPLTSRLAPLFREITFSFAAMAQRQAIGEAVSDPYLFRHFAARLDARMLEHLQEDLQQGGKLTRGALRQNLPLHLNLTLEGIVSPGFARLAATAQRTGARFGVEISLMEATADPALMEYGRRLLDMAGFPLIVDGLDYVGLTMTHPAGLKPALVKVSWSPRLADSAPPVKAAIEDAIARIGPERIVLQRAESEEALVWGQANGIARYQGYYLDAVQAAARIANCHSARACTLRQCVSRAGTLSPAIRAACGNPGLLDMAPHAREPVAPVKTPAHAGPRPH